MKKTLYENEVAALGQRIGKSAHGGQVIELIGDVGAGKTTLTRAIARGLGITTDIHSPTFTIKNQYEAPNGLRLVHYDFYRLHEAGVMRDELNEAIDDKQTIVVIEWGDIIADILPEDRMTITLVPEAEESREVTIVSHGDQSKKLEDLIG